MSSAHPAATVAGNSVKLRPGRIRLHLEARPVWSVPGSSCSIIPDGRISHLHDHRAHELVGRARGQRYGRAAKLAAVLPHLARAGGSLCRPESAKT